MQRLKRLAACLAAALALTAAGAQGAAAAGIVLKNEMELGITAVSCVDEAGATKAVVGALAKETSVTVPPAKFPEYECGRIAVHADDGNGWQFYFAPEAGAAKEIIFSMDGVSPYTEEKYPCLLIELEDDTYISPAGVSLDTLAQLMQFGLDAAKWKEVATPGYTSFKQPGAFAVSFAGHSWNFAGDGLSFKELVPGMMLVESAKLTAPFSNSSVAAALEGFKELGCVPVLGEFGKEKPTNPSWEDLEGLLERAADAEGGTLRMLLGNEDIMFDLTLDLSSSKAELTVTRNPEAAFG